MIENITRLIPIITLIIIGSGLINLNVYYSAFNIRITDFMEWNEILALFLNDLGKFFFQILPYSSIGVFVNLEGLFKDKHEIDSEKRNFFKDPISLLIVFIAIIIAGTAASFDILSNTIITDHHLMYLFIIGIIFVSYRLKKVMDLLLPSEKFNIYYKYILISILILNFYNVVNGWVSVYRIKHYVNLRNISIDLIEKQHVYPFSEEYYIGQTKEYVFIYNNQKEETIVYPISSVKRITIFDRPYYTPSLTPKNPRYPLHK